MSTVSASAKRAARSPWAERLGRVGYGAKGVLYGIVAVLAIQVAAGERGTAKDQGGALQTVAEQPFGTFLLVVLVAGLAGYALWRLVEAVRGPDDKEGAKALARRAASLGQAIVYGALCAAAVSILAGEGAGGSGGEERATATVLELPGGVGLVIVAGIAVIGVGVFNAYRALTRNFRDDLRTAEMNRVENRWATRVGVAGLAARAAVFSLIGTFLVKAALDYDPDDGIGLDGALQKLSQQPYGAYLLGAVAAGLLVYAVFCLVEARYRDL